MYKHKSKGNLLLRERERETGVGGRRGVEGKGNGKNCIYLFFVNSFFLLTYSLMFLLCKILALDECEIEGRRCVNVAD